MSRFHQMSNKTNVQMHNITLCLYWSFNDLSNAATVSHVSRGTASKGFSSNVQRPLPGRWMSTAGEWPVLIDRGDWFDYGNHRGHFSWISGMKPPAIKISPDTNPTMHYRLLLQYLSPPYDLSRPIKLQHLCNNTLWSRQSGIMTVFKLSVESTMWVLSVILKNGIMLL